MAATISDLLEKLATSAQKMVEEKLDIRRLVVVVDKRAEFQHVGDRHARGAVSYETTFFSCTSFSLANNCVVKCNVYQQQCHVTAGVTSHVLNKEVKKLDL